MTNNDPLKTYVNNLKAFKNHMQQEYDSLMGDTGTDATCHEFYSSNFIITFRGETINLGNGAEIFQGIEELIDFEIDEWEEK